MFKIIKIQIKFLIFSIDFIFMFRGWNVILTLVSLWGITVPILLEKLIYMLKILTKIFQISKNLNIFV